MAAALLPLMAVVVVAYLVTGVAMPVIPVYVHQGLGLGLSVVFLVSATVVVCTAGLGVMAVGSGWPLRRATESPIPTSPTKASRVIA